MSTVLAAVNNQQPIDQCLWDCKKNLEEIRQLFAPKLSEIEFKFFVGLGKACKLNPFTREIWAVKYQENSPSQIFIGRDGYRKAAQAHSDYDFHQCDAVYANDDFEVNNGEVNHKYKLSHRGELIGAYCIVKRHRSSRPIYVFADLKEYSTGKSLWNSQTGKPATMIKKVAESQCLRACFQDLLGGTYGEEEWSKTLEEQKSLKLINSDTNTNKLKQLLYIKEEDTNAKNDVNNDSYDNPLTIEYEKAQDTLPISGEQLEKISKLFYEKNFSEERMNKALVYYKVNAFNELDSPTAENFISLLERA